jgi:hypothetical protein
VNKLVRIFLMYVFLPGAVLVGLHDIGIAQEKDPSFRRLSVMEKPVDWTKRQTVRSLESSLKKIFLVAANETPTKRGIQVEANRVPIKESVAPKTESRAPKKETMKPSPAKRWGVVIGINNYQQISPLNYAVNDAKAVGSKLTNLGFDEVIYLENEAATKSGIEGTLNELVNKVGPDDTVVVFFAGHGNTVEMANGSRMGYWVPFDGNMDQAIATGISMDTVRLLSQAIPARYLLYLIDACYSGLALRQMWPGEGEGFVRQIITAGRSGEEVVEIEGHGIFTRLLLQAFDGAADVNRDGRMSVSELGVFLQSEVSHQSHQEQNPLFGRWSGEEELVFQVPDSVDERAEPVVSRAAIAMERQGTTVKEDNSLVRVLVMIPEILDGQPIPSPRAEGIVMRKLIEGGMEVIDQEQIDEIRNPDEIKEFLLSGTSKQARWLGKQYGAHMVVIGEAIGQTFYSNIAGGRFFSTDVQLQAKVLSVKTGNVLDTYSVEGKGIGKSPLFSGKKGFEKAGKQMGELIMEKSKTFRP